MDAQGGRRAFMCGPEARGGSCVYVEVGTFVWFGFGQELLQASNIYGVDGALYWDCSRPNK